MSKKDDLETPENEELRNNDSGEMASSDEERENVTMDADGEESELSDDEHYYFVSLIHRPNWL